MTVFYSLAALLTLLVVVWLVRPLLRSVPQASVSSQRLNTDIYRDRISASAAKSRTGECISTGRRGRNSVAPPEDRWGCIGPASTRDTTTRGIGDTPPGDSEIRARSNRKWTMGTIDTQNWDWSRRSGCDIHCDGVGPATARTSTGERIGTRCRGSNGVTTTRY